MPPISIALCGKSPQIAGWFTQLMKPEFDIVHVCSNVSAAKTELPLLLGGQSVTPQSGQGSNSQSSEVKIPKAVVVGGGFSLSEVEDMRSVEGARDLVWVYLDKITQAGFSSADPMGVIAGQTKKAFAERGFKEGLESEFKPSLWMC